jgi:hypothetical protein
MATSELAADSLYPILAEESIADKLGGMVQSQK